MRAAEHWNRLPRDIVDASLLEVFKDRLDGASTSLAVVQSSRSLCTQNHVVDTDAQAYPKQAIWSAQRIFGVPRGFFLKKSNTFLNLFPLLFSHPLGLKESDKVCHTRFLMDLHHL